MAESGGFPVAVYAVSREGRVYCFNPQTGDERPLTGRKHSDRLLEVLLKFRYGEQMADRLRVKVEDTGLSADALLAMPADERAQLVALLSKYNAARPHEEDRDDE